MINRREFLKGMAAAGGYFAFRGLLPDLARSENRKKFPPGVWGGNVSTFCHDLVRDRGRIPQVMPNRRVDVCIVGGGLSGLTAGYKLRDSSVFLLEHLDRIGGHAVRDRWNNIWFSGAAAYFVAPEPPLDKLYEDLKLPIQKIPEPTESAILSYNPVIDPFGSGLQSLPYPAKIQRDFARAKKDFMDILDGEDCPIMPIHKTTEASKKYDQISFADWLLKEKKYHMAVKSYIDLYCRSAFGAPSSGEISAFAGINFYASEFGDRYAFPGGNAVAAELLRDAIEKVEENQIVLGATVVSVETEEKRAIVTYVDRDGKFSAIEAKAVVMAAPKYIARLMIKGLPKDQFNAMGELRYGSYIVANVLCSTPIVKTSYDTWTDTTPFTDFIVADWVPPHGRSEKQVLTVYYPIGYQHSLLLTDNAYDDYRTRVVEHFDILYPGAESKIEDVRLYRWGHALCHGKSGWYTQKAAVASRSMGRIFFGHSDNQGLPAFESALAEGMSAAEQLIATITKRA